MSGHVRWMQVAHMHMCASAKPKPAGENGGWANRFRLEARHYSSRYTAGFNLPHVGLCVEAFGWELGLYVEY